MADQFAGHSVESLLERIEELEKKLNLIEKERSRLSKPAILRKIKEGSILIDPFNAENIGSTQYDVTLGYHYWRKKDIHKGGYPTFNPYDETQVRSIWQHETAVPASLYLKDINFRGSVQDYFGENIFPHNKIILIGPLETILAHTEEFVGGRYNITTDMSARSSMGRNHIEVCKCAGTGDIGFFNRWTMEITNNEKDRQIVLVVGRRIAQIKFYETEPLEAENDDYAFKGKYQSSANLEDLKKNWTPDDMLPKMWKDKEVERDRGECENK